MSMAQVFRVALIATCFSSTSCDRKLFSNRDKEVVCLAAAGEICPDKQWMEDYYKIKKIQKPYIMPQEEADLIEGIAKRLNDQIPKGYRWDNDKLKFVQVEQKK